MATVNYSVPDDVKKAFDRAFKNRNKSAIIADLMRRAVAEAETERRRAQDAIGRELKAATREAQVLATAARRARDRRDRAATAVVAAEETVLAAELAVDAARSELVRLDTELDDAETKAGAAQQLAAELADRLAE